MDMSGTTTNETAYTGAVCMSLVAVGNTTSLPLSDPFCNTDACLAFKAAHAASQAAVSYYHQYDYGHYTTWYYLAVLGVAMVAHGFRLYRNRYPPADPGTAVVSSGAKMTWIGRRVAAVARAISYRSVGGAAAAARWGMPRLGMLAVLLFSSLFFLLMTFLVHPYYRDRRGYGSPPLGVRAGLMSTALIPIIVALSSKVNVITWLTGLGHERLNILHRWASYLCLFLAVVHTVPFIVTPLQKCGSAGLRAQFYKKGGLEFTGTPPLGMLVGLIVLSVPFIRHRFYNFFYRLHIPLYMAYLGLMFWHATDEEDSWAYLWATLAIWLFSVLVRLFHKWQTFNVRGSWWFSGFPTTIEELPGGMTRLRVLVPTSLKWKPGQHCWIRMPHLSVLQNHPFTIANLPQEGASDPATARTQTPPGGMHAMDFYVRAHRGLSLDLLHSVADRQDRPATVHIDGPYGGLIQDVPALYQSLVFVAGGSGIAACLPHVLATARRIKAGTAMVSRMRIIWMVRQPGHTRWVIDELKEAAALLEGLATLNCDYYVTDSRLPVEGSSDGVDVEKAADGQHPDQKPDAEKTSALSVIATSSASAVRNRRPFLPEILPPLLTERRVFVFGCGPESLRVDLGNAVAIAQSKVLSGQADSIALHTEMFGW